MKTLVLLDHEPVADGGWMVHALLRLEGEARLQPERPPLNLCLVLDRSGSMAGEKLHAARRAAAGLVRRLAPTDRVSVVAFDERADVVAWPGTGADQEDLPLLLEAIEPGGITNLSAAWLRARDLLAAARTDDSVDRILLLTDGQANAGLTDPAQLIGLCRVGAAAGIGTSTFGFGADFDEDLLRAMADAGGGNTWYIEHPDQAPTLFAEEVQGLLELCAQNVRVGVAAGPDTEAVKVLHDYPSQVEGDVLWLEVGDLYAREPRRVLLELLVDPVEEGAARVGHVRVTGHVVTAGGGLERHDIDIPITLHPVDGGRAVPEVRKEVLLLEAARLREQALRAREHGDGSYTARLLPDWHDRVREAGAFDAEMEEELDDLQRLSARLQESAPDATDIKYAKQRAHLRQRSRSASLRHVRRAEPLEDGEGRV